MMSGSIVERLVERLVELLQHKARRLKKKRYSYLSWLSL
jgi:hypothetical protein